MKEGYEQLILKDKKLSLQYQFLYKLGKGAFGQVFCCVKLSTKETIALKVEFSSKDPKNLTKSHLYREYQILKKLQGTLGVAKVFQFKAWGHGYLLEMEKMGNSLEYELNKKFKFREIRSMISELLMILKKIHAKGIVHQDLKPSNIMRTQQGGLAIIDFGLSGIIKQDSSENKHQKFGFVGTPRYASLAAHRGIRQKPKDDIESLLYVLAYMYSKSAPWSKIRLQKTNKFDIIYKYKSLKNKQWLQRCGKPFIQSYNYLEELEQGQEVDYGYIIKLFQYHRESLIVNTNELPKYKRKMSTYVDSPFIINVQEIHNCVTQNLEELGKKQNEGDQLNFFANSQNNFSTQVFDERFLERALTFITGSLVSQRFSEDLSFKSQKTEDNDEPSANGFQKFHFPTFRNPFISNT